MRNNGKKLVRLLVAALLAAALFTWRCVRWKNNDK